MSTQESKDQSFSTHYSNRIMHQVFLNNVYCFKNNLYNQKQILKFDIKISNYIEKNNHGTNKDEQKQME